MPYLKAKTKLRKKIQKLKKVLEGDVPLDVVKNNAFKIEETRRALEILENLDKKPVKVKKPEPETIRDKVEKEVNE